MALEAWLVSCAALEDTWTGWDWKDELEGRALEAWGLTS